MTPTVVRGFATGAAAAEGALAPHDVALADRAGMPAERGALFAWYLGDAGQAGCATSWTAGPTGWSCPSRPPCSPWRGCCGPAIAMRRTPGDR
ncbi:hypothetical protein [Asanoa iriomotensis]|uniref:hypothetical protein n=1 Tax=Asanoa iriomotensis TaxID=234613 RepID=UPI001945379E|nr:hypothetical protein [Asanoa iriomotensis]